MDSQFLEYSLLAFAGTLFHSCKKWMEYRTRKAHIDWDGFFMNMFLSVLCSEIVIYTRDDFSSFLPFSNGVAVLVGITGQSIIRGAAIVFDKAISQFVKSKK